MKLIEVEGADGCMVKLQRVELRVYYADGASRVCEFLHPRSAVKQLERDFKDYAISDVRIIPVYTKGEKER